MKISTLFLFLIFLAGCGVANVVTRGEYVDSQSIPPGMHRKELLARFGAPIDSQKDTNGLITDIFRVEQGEKAAGKVLKGGGILLIDIFTLGLSEAIATPVTETKRYVTFEILYDESERVTSAKFLGQ